jgi:hypothetical protein
VFLDCHIETIKPSGPKDNINFEAIIEN